MYPHYKIQTAQQARLRCSASQQSKPYTATSPHRRWSTTRRCTDQTASQAQAHCSACQQDTHHTKTQSHLQKKTIPQRNFQKDGTAP
jgi:hypothetical protein